MHTVGELIAFVLWACVLVLIARFVIDWVQVLARSWRPRGFVLVLCEFIYTLTDPPLRALRRVIPPLRLGAVAIDLSPMLLLIALFLLRGLNEAIFAVVVRLDWTVRSADCGSDRCRLTRQTGVRCAGEHARPR